VREGEKASHPLERVFVDLCGPIRPTSSSGGLYSMNVIDDFSSYVWSLPLRSKGDAASILQMWHRAVTNQSDNRLQILVTDDGEPVSNAMNHRRTAPYTSAQNGRAERLHRTLLEKARDACIMQGAPRILGRVLRYIGISHQSHGDVFPTRPHPIRTLVRPQTVAVTSARNRLPRFRTDPHNDPKNVRSISPHVSI